MDGIAIIYFQLLIDESSFYKWILIALLNSDDTAVYLISTPQHVALIVLFRKHCVLCTAARASSYFNGFPDRKKFSNSMRISWNSFSRPITRSAFCGRNIFAIALHVKESPWGCVQQCLSTWTGLREGELAGDVLTLNHII